MDFELGMQARAAAPSEWDQLAADGLLVLVAGTKAPALGGAVGTALAQGLTDGDFAPKGGSSLYLHRPAGVQAPRLAFVWVADTSAAAVKRGVAAGLALFKSGGCKSLAVGLVAGGASAGLRAQHAHALVSACNEGLYVYRATKPSAPARTHLASVTAVCAKPDEANLAVALATAKATASGVALARELANRPGNHCTPTWLAEQAQLLGRSHGLQVQVLGRKECERLGMGSFLAVAQGSAQEPKFIVAQWLGGRKADAPVVLVGKGITFDTGGISIKPAGEMDEMKFDMGGAASVLGTMRALAEAKAKVNVVALVPTCENMPGGRAVKPGDVVTSMSGQTVEILNTDAEGRLILCDALTYAERFKPLAVVDVATLTGACMIALGHIRSGLFSSDEALAKELLAAGETALDPAWRMPLDDEYGEALKSNFADMANVGPRAGGAITAAMFLKRYTAKFAWAHLDVAGTAWKSGAQKGATGRPVPLLVHWLLNRKA